MGGKPECSVRGGAASGRSDTYGRIDVCSRGSNPKDAWEVKAFGPTGVEDALAQLQRYIDAAATNGGSDRYRRGTIVPPALIQAGNTLLVAFSPEPGLRMYAPVSGITNLLEDPERGPLVREAWETVRDTEPSFVFALPEVRPDAVLITGGAAAAGYIGYEIITGLVHGGHLVTAK